MKSKIVTLTVLLLIANHCVSLGLTSMDSISYYRNLGLYGFLTNDFQTSKMNYKKSFEFGNRLFFDQYIYGRSLIECNELKKAEDVFIGLIEKGYPYDSVIEMDEIFHDLNEGEKLRFLKSKHVMSIGVEHQKVFRQFSDLAILDSETRANCDTANCFEWKQVTENNISFLLRHFRSDEDFCINDIGFASSSVRLILLHGKTKENFEVLNMIVENQLKRGCVPPEFYAYWYDGYLTEIFDRDEVYGTISLLEYRRNGTLPDNDEILGFEKKRKEIGLISFSKEIDIYAK